METIGDNIIPLTDEQLVARQTAQNLNYALGPRQIIRQNPSYSLTHALIPGATIRQVESPDPPTFTLNNQLVDLDTLEI